MKKTQIIVPLVKIDVRKRLVWGCMTSEAVDKASEVMDYDTSKPYFEKWSEGISKATDGKSLGNVRSMHQPIAAGKLVDMSFEDTQKLITICAKVVDDQEWKKVEEGVYTGFSIGGKYVRRWDDPEDSTIKRFTVDPVEVSLVDNPCNPDSHFTAIKMDGGEEERLFKSVIKMEPDMDPTNEQVAARATEMAKAAGDETKWPSYLDAARDALKSEAAPEPTPVEPATEVTEPAPEGGEPAAEPAPSEGSTDDSSTADTADTAPVERAAGPVQVWKTPDGTTFASKRDALAHMSATVSPVQAALDAALGKAAPEEPMAGGDSELSLSLKKWSVVLEELAQVRKNSDVVEKGLYEVGRLAEILQSLSYVAWACNYERESEGDGSVVPEQVADGIRTLGEALVAMAQEEVAELLGELERRGVTVATVIPDDGVVELAAAVELVKADEALMQKIGARNSTTDQQRIQKMHDTSVELGADCEGAGKFDEADLQKMAETSPVIKALLADRETDRAALREAQDEIKKAVDGIAELGETIKKQSEQISAMGKQPAPMAPRTSVVSKDGATIEARDERAEAIKVVEELSKTAEGREQLARAAIIASQSAGHTI